METCHLMLTSLNCAEQTEMAEKAFSIDARSQHHRIQQRHYEYNDSANCPNLKEHPQSTGKTGHIKSLKVIQAGKSPCGYLAAYAFNKEAHCQSAKDRITEKNQKQDHCRRNKEKNC